MCWPHQWAFCPLAPVSFLCVLKSTKLLRLHLRLVLNKLLSLHFQSARPVREALQACGQSILINMKLIYGKFWGCSSHPSTNKINSQIKFKDWWRKINVIMFFFFFKLQWLFQLSAAARGIRLVRLSLWWFHQSVTHWSRQTQFQEYILKPHFFPSFKATRLLIAVQAGVGTMGETEREVYWDLHGFMRW